MMILFQPVTATLPAPSATACVMLQVVGVSVNHGLLPPCEQYFRNQGYDFRFSNGKVILVRKARRLRSRRQILPHQGSPEQSGTGLGLVRVTDGAGLRFTVDNLPTSMEYQMVIRYESEMGLIQSFYSVQDFCSQSDLDSLSHFRCVGLDVYLGSQDSLPKICEDLVKSLSARIHNGAVGERFTANPQATINTCNVIGSLGSGCSKLDGFCE
ncbi:hypothetical protein GOODEAATRI_023995, partial [Goodea atripinnis]